MDSYVGHFSGNGVELGFDYGNFSNSLEDEREPTYLVSETFVGKFRARIVSPKSPGHGITGIYVPNVIGSHSLNISANDLSGTQQELALKMFRTLQFNPARDTQF